MGNSNTTPATGSKASTGGLHLNTTIIMVVIFIVLLVAIGMIFLLSALHGAK
jgi:flagellar basal body-associated protein FliL